MNRTRNELNRSVMLCAALIAAGAAHGDYQGLQVQLHTNVVAGQYPRSVYRVYATFDDPGDFTTAVAGSPTLGNLVLQTTSQTGTLPGGNFWNAPGGLTTAPSAGDIAPNPGLEWDTFVTIGLALVPYGGSDNVGLAPGWPGIGDVAEINTDYAGWFTAGATPQGMAGNGVPLSGGLWGVIIMQLTVDEGNHVRGTVAIGGVQNNPLSGGTTFYATNQTFNSLPAPGSLAVLALGGAMRGRRRRSEIHNA